MAISGIVPETPNGGGQSPVASTPRRARRGYREGTAPAGNPISRKDLNAMLAAALTQPGSLALGTVAASTSTALDEQTNPASLLPGNLADPNAGAAVNAADPAGPALQALAGLLEPAMTALASTLASTVPSAANPAVKLVDPSAVSQAVSPAASPSAAALEAAPLAALDTTVATALGSANSAAQDAAAVARDAAATAVQAAQAVAVAADAVSAAMAAVQAAQAGQTAGNAGGAALAITQDAAGLGADATAKYLGAGFMGLPAGPVNAKLADATEAVPAVVGVPATTNLAANTYSNPHERSFGQAGAALTGPMAPAALSAEGPDLDLKA
ncbi:MAG: hypothetical protein P4L36_03750 [Holophaga sp.]|nr:hypothetical protein [Holophaga sp.]